MHGFGDMRTVEALAGTEVGNRSSDLEKAVVSARREAKTRDRVLEKAS
jgi:hypothetical protein